MAKRIPRKKQGGSQGLLASESGNAPKKAPAQASARVVFFTCSITGNETTIRNALGALAQGVAIARAPSVAWPDEPTTEGA